MFDAIVRYFGPPVPPAYHIPWWAKSMEADINASLDRAWTLCHLDGLEKGFVLGLAAATLVLLISTRLSIAKGAGNATK